MTYEEIQQIFPEAYLSKYTIEEGIFPFGTGRLYSGIFDFDNPIAFSFFIREDEYDLFSETAGSILKDRINHSIRKHIEERN